MKFVRGYRRCLGILFDVKARTLSLYLYSGIGVEITFPEQSRCLFRPHAWSGWLENLDRNATSARYRQCNRCGKIEVGA